MSKIYVIMGKSATGKDSLYQKIVQKHPELKQIVSYTTRPIRAGEKYGREYFFVSEQEMIDLRLEGKIIECREYETVHGSWFYFTAQDGQIQKDSDEKYILISTLEGYQKLEAYYGREMVVPIYIEVDDFARIQRAINREKEQKSPCVAELCRRFLADEEDFSRDNLQQAGIERGIVNDDLEIAFEKIEKLLEDSE